jgi:hypothetical protein
MPTKKVLASAAMQKLPPPPAWRMDPYLSNLFELLGSKSKIALQISLLTLEYDKKCAQAKIELYNEINNLMNPTKKKY